MRREKGTPFSRWEAAFSRESSREPWLMRAMFSLYTLVVVGLLYHGLTAPPFASFALYAFLLMVGNLLCGVAFWLPRRNRGRLFGRLFRAGFGLVALGLVLILADYLLIEAF